MDDVNFECKVCSCQRYTIVDGFYYCEDCGFQNDTVVMVHDDFARRRGDKTKLKESTATKQSEASRNQEKREITTWESHNYILKGLTDQLVELGAPEGLKLTVFQLWAFYLRLNEAAFFSKDETALPKLGLIAQFRDTKILYNFPERERKAYKRSRSSTGTMSRRQKRRKLTSLVNFSQMSEYNSVMASQRSLNASSLADMSASDVRSLATSSASSANTIELEFSELAKRTLLKNMSREHMRAHARDFNREMKCHKRIGRTVQIDEKMSVLRKGTLITILMLALDLHETDFRLTDLIRFIREGHLTTVQVEHFLPADVTEKHVRHTQKCFSIDSSTHSGLRILMNSTSKLLLMDNRCPDMYALCSRYVDELALPRDMMTIIGRIIRFCEPKFKVQVSAHLQHLYVFYEGRAIAYVIFVLKLLFGINDETENLISASAKKINTKNPGKKLFVWTEWLAYIEMRNTVLAKYHAPTRLRLKGAEECHGNVYQRMLENQKRILVDEDGDVVHREPFVLTVRPNPKRNRSAVGRYKFLQEFFPTLEKIFPAEPDELKNFAPTLTPCTTYLETILELHPEYQPLFADDQRERALFPFLEPEKFQAELAATHNIHINIKTAPVATHFKYHKHRRAEHKDLRLKNYHRPKFYKVRTNISAEDWFKDLCERDQEVSETRTKHQEKYHKSAKEEFDKYREKMYKRYKKTYPHQDAETAVEFLTPNYDVWLNLLRAELNCTTMYKKLETDFPAAFNWLIEECASMVESYPADVYNQLMVVENFFTHIIRPVKNVEDDLKFRNLDELPRLVKSMTQNLHKCW